MLSVQCRDAVALQATERLREALGGAITVDRVRRADVSAVSARRGRVLLKTTKARYVRECADAIATAPEFRGRVPRDVPGLMRLPGVGPKLAHLVASVAFGEEEEEREEEDSGDKAGAKRAEERTTEGEEGGRRTETEAAAAGPSGTEAAGGDGTLRDGTTTVHRASSPRGATGFVVDTHARRVAARLGWTSGATPRPPSARGCGWNRSSRGRSGTTPAWRWSGSGRSGARRGTRGATGAPWGRGVPSFSKRRRTKTMTETVTETEKVLV